MCQRSGTAFVPYFPLESGLLTGKYHLGEPPPTGTRLAAWGERASNFIDDDRLRTVAALTKFAERADGRCSSWRSAGWSRTRW